MPVLQVVMGSKSDKPVVRASGLYVTLNEVIGRENYHASVYSAHRNPRELDEFVSTSITDGTKVFIGIAGMAAALPGAIAGASNMSRLVIGVPLDDKGIDSCIHMPPGVPVATAGVGKTGLKQAALLACQALAINNEQVEHNLVQYLLRNSKEVEDNFDTDTKEWEEI